MIATRQEFNLAMDEGGGTIVRAPDGLNLRPTPSLGAPPLDLMPNGARFTLTGNSRIGLIEGTADGQMGWVSLEHLVVPHGDFSRDRVATVQFAEGTKLRATPSMEASVQVLAVLPQGAGVTLTGEHRLGFLAGRYGNQQGWAYGEYLDAAPALGPDDETTGTARDLIIGGINWATQFLSVAGGAWAALDVHNSEIRRAAEVKGVPANLIKSMINRESSGNWERDGERTPYIPGREYAGRILPFVGIFEVTASSWGYSFNQMIGNKYLQVEAMAHIIHGLWVRYRRSDWETKTFKDFDRAATVYFGGPAALEGIFCDEFGMCSNEYTRKTVDGWRFLDSLVS